jgi:hypothetical protein
MKRSASPAELGQPHVVDRIIRDFTTEVLGLFGREDFLTQLDFRCRALNGLFLGSSPSDTYQRGPWNAPDQLGEYVLKALHIDGETRLAVRDAFTIYTAALLSVADQDAEFDPATIEPLIANLRVALLGLDSAVPFRAM